MLLHLFSSSFLKNGSFHHRCITVYHKKKTELRILSNLSNKLHISRVPRERMYRRKCIICGISLHFIFKSSSILCWIYVCAYMHYSIQNENVYRWVTMNRIEKNWSGFDLEKVINSIIYKILSMYFFNRQKFILKDMKKWMKIKL